MATNNSIIELFNNIKGRGFYARTNNLDGLAKWKEIRSELSTHPSKATKFNISNKFLIFSSKIQYLDTDDENFTISINSAVLNNRNIPDHFFVQLFRIIYLYNVDYKISFERLMQIAYNIGQFTASQIDGSVNPVVSEFFNKNLMESVKSYVDIS